ncbi:MAG: hypothetical protein ACT4PP_09280 [Sporichthyaceae bacterium]
MKGIRDNLGKCGGCALLWNVRKTEFPTAGVYGDLDHPGLRLITCGGPLDPVTGNYRDNTLVFAGLVSVIEPGRAGLSERTALSY